MRRFALFCALALCFSCASRAEDYYFVSRGGHICYAEKSSGRWVDTGSCPPDAASRADRAILSGGMHLHGRAALSRALEDFCS